MIDEAAFEHCVEIARRIYAESGFLPALDDTRLEANRFALWIPFDGDELLDDLIGLQDDADPVRRAVVGAGLCRLLTEAIEAEDFAMVTDALRRFVSSVPVSALSDPLLLRWESHAAATAGDLERVLAIGRRFEDLGAAADYLGLAATTAFILLHPGSQRPFTPSRFDPDIRAPKWNPVATDHLNYLYATIVDPRPNLPLTDPEDFSASHRDALLVADASLSRLKSGTGELTPTQQAIKAWFTFALGAATRDRGRLAVAGDAFLSVARHPLETDAFSDRPMLCRAAATCYARALKWPDAIVAAQEWCAGAPNDAEAHRRLAESLYKDERIPEAITAYEDYVGLRKEGANDWEPNLLLRLGMDFLTQRKLAAALEAAAFSTVFRPQGETLLTWFSEWFPKLSNKARERWWVGMFTISSPHVAAGIGTALWDQAADCFGEAVAFELKERVFRPFAASQPTLKAQDEYWRRVLAGKGTLGEMIECLLQARVPLHPVAKELRKWLDAHQPALQKHLSKIQPHQLIALTKLRGQAQHGEASLTETETRAVFAEAGELL